MSLPLHPWSGEGLEQLKIQEPVSLGPLNSCPVAVPIPLPIAAGCGYVMVCHGMSWPLCLGNTELCLGASVPLASKLRHPVETAQPFSVGSAGHPYTCSAACKYVWRKQGCRDGADCPNCHYCKWQRRPKEESESPTLEGLDSMLVNIPPPPGLTPMQPMEAKTLGLSDSSGDFRAF